MGGRRNDPECDELLRQLNPACFACLMSGDGFDLSLEYGFIARPEGMSPIGPCLAGGVIPPPPPPVVVPIDILIYTPEETATAAAELSTAFATLATDPAAEGTPPPPVVEIAATVGFAIDIETIAWGSSARTEFEEGFRLSMAGSIGGGVAVTPDRIIIDAITASRRRLLDTETEPGTDLRRTQSTSPPPPPASPVG